MYEVYLKNMKIERVNAKYVKFQDEAYWFFDQPVATVDEPVAIYTKEVVDTIMKEVKND